MSASNKHKQGVLMEYLPPSPLPEWTQPSQGPAPYNLETSDPESFVPQAEIGKIPLAKVQLGPGIKNLMATPHPPYMRLTVNIVLLG